MSFPERKRHLTSIKNMCLNHFRKFNFLLKWFPELRSSPSFWSWIFTWSYVKSDLSDPTWASVNHMGFFLDPPPEKIHPPLPSARREKQKWHSCLTRRLWFSGSSCHIIVKFIKQTSGRKPGSIEYYRPEQLRPINIQSLYQVYTQGSSNKWHKM